MADKKDDEQTPYEKARAALEEAAKGEGAEAEKAKKALAAMDDPDKDGDDKKDDPDKDGDKDAKTEADDDDVDKGLLKLLATKPLKEVKAILGAMEKKPIAPAAPITTVPATRGAGQGSGSSSRLGPDAKADLDLRMGLVAEKAVAVHSEHKLQLGVRKPAPPAENKSA